MQGMRVGVASPFFAKTDTEPGRGDGSATIENSYFRDYVGVAVATAYSPTTTMAPIKKAVVRNSRFEPLGGVPAARCPAAAISMNYGMSAGDAGAPRPGHRLRLQPVIRATPSRVTTCTMRLRRRLLARLRYGRLAAGSAGSKASQFFVRLSGSRVRGTIRPRSAVATDVYQENSMPNMTRRTLLSAGRRGACGRPADVPVCTRQSSSRVRRHTHQCVRRESFRPILAASAPQGT